MLFSPLLFRFSKPNSCLIVFFFLSSSHNLSCALSQQKHTLCDNLFQCGNITVGFPFWGESRPEACGHPSLVLHCYKNKTTLIISGQMYQILQIDNSSNTLRVARQDFLDESFCSATFSGTTLNPQLFELLSDYKTLFVYYLCKSGLHNPANFTCPKIGVASVHRDNENHENCGGMFNITVPKSYDPCQECRYSGGICAYSADTPVCLNLSES